MKCYNCKLNGICKEIRNKSKEHFKWSFHNLIAHPLSEIIFLLGFERASNKLHDWSIPIHKKGEGRG